jgi:hypothetical protein
MQISKIRNLIHVVRGQRVMLDADLAALYRVKTKELNKAVARNPTRFPTDFMFELKAEEASNLRFQFGTSSWGGRRYLPRVFTEQGVAMLSSVLNSEHAVSVNIDIMRAFVRLRSAVAASNKLAELVQKIARTQISHEHELGEHAVDIHELFAAMRKLRPQT